MKQVIDDIQYDTETDNLLAGYDISHDQTDKEYLSIGLYCTQYGKWYLYQNDTEDDYEQITPYTIEQADRWIKAHAPFVSKEDQQRVYEEISNTGLKA